MKKGGVGGGNTKTGLIFEGKTDLVTFLAKQDGYRANNSEEIFYNDKLVARVFKKHKFYNVFLRELGIDWKEYISRQLLPDDSIYVILNNTLFIIECKHQETEGSTDEKLQTCDLRKNNIRN